MVEVTYRYFTEEEFACQCGCGLTAKPYLIEALDEIRETLGGPITIISGARCEKHNASVGGRPASQHLTGLAADLACSQHRRSTLITLLHADPRFNGIGLGPTKLHADVRPGPRRHWFYA